MLKKIEFENYRCFSRASLDFRDMTIIVGKNNAGKSTIIEALRLVAAAQKKSKSTNYTDLPRFLGLPNTYKGFSLNTDKLKIDLRTVIRFYTGDYARVIATFENNVSVQIYLYIENVYVLIFDHNQNNVYSRAQAHNIMIDQIQINILPQIGLIIENEKPILKETVDKDIDTYLTSRHFRNEIRYYKENYFETFKEFAEKTWPGLRIRELLYNPSESEYIRFFVQDNNFPAEIGLMGSGLQMWLQIIWFISRCIDSDIVILDEPDVYMHPDMQRRILDIVRDKYKLYLIEITSLMNIFKSKGIKLMKLILIFIFGRRKRLKTIS